LVADIVADAWAALWSRRFENNVYVQIGLIMLIGLSAKNALAEAALIGARIRLRPILITSFAMKLRPLHYLWCLLLVGGCAVGPNFKAPDARVPAVFRGAEQAGTNSLGDLGWWQLFRDPVLQGLVHTALTNNYDLRVAAARVEESLALLAQSRSVFYPQLSYQGATGAGRNVSAGLPANTGSGVFRGNELAGNVSWEIDLWGRLRRLNESARAQYLATEEARRNVTISLIASVAQAYLQLLALDEDLAIAQQTTNSLAQSLSLFNQRLEGGVSSKLESASAGAALASAAATIPEVGVIPEQHTDLVFLDDDLTPLRWVWRRRTFIRT
jgi:Outer membrane efflux protein